MQVAFVVTKINTEQRDWFAEEVIFHRATSATLFTKFVRQLEKTHCSHDYSRAP